MDRGHQARIVGAGIAVGTGLAGVGQLIPPLHLLTHEFTQGFTAASLFLAAGLAWWTGRTLPQGRWREAAWIALWAVGAMGAAAFGTQLLANALSYRCRTEHAIGFFWVTWVPTALLGAGIGAAAARWGLSAWRTLLLLLLLCAASAAHDGLQYLAGVRIVDPLLGDPLMFNQRTGMEIPGIHAWQRLWLLCVAIGLWAVARRRQRGDQPVGTALALIPALALTFGGGSHVGVGCGRHALRRHLDAERHSEHFVFLYSSTGRASVHIDQVVRDGEWHYARLAEAWGITPQRKIEVRLFDTREELGRLTGRPWPHAGFYQIDIPLSRTRTSTYPHELVHALHAELSYNPRLIYDRGMTEGAAVAFSEHLAALPAAHVSQAVALRTDQLPRAQDFMAPGGFHAVNEGNAYDAAGSFLGFLVLRYGLDAFVQLQRTFDWRGTYGHDLDALDAQWRAFLAEVPVDPARHARERDAFDPELRPSYLSRRCPKLGANEETLSERADRLRALGDHDSAQALYRRLLERQGKTRWAVRAAVSLSHLERDAEALELLQAHLHAGDLDDDERFLLLERQIPGLLELDRFDALGDVLEQLVRLDPAPHRAHHHLRACLMDPQLQSPVASFLRGGEGWRARALLEQLQLVFPERSCLRFVWAAYATTLDRPPPDLSLTRGQRRRLDEAANAVSAAPDACELVGGRLLEWADHAVRLSELELAGQLAGTVAEHCADPVLHHEATLRMERIGWERSRAAP
ncbi:MAG TPA: hypothetical protein ENK18_07740 [Deltaproteobacteria bacterium]|nr:hypothetical protein [Deltaproteobacteria bacterium]